MKRWNPLRAAAWGACIGGIIIAAQLFGQWGTQPLAYLLGQVLGGAAGGGVLFSVAAVLRNLVVRTR
jgi:hypothetical protein